MPGFSASHSAWFTVEGLVVKAINRAFQSSTAERLYDVHHNLTPKKWKLFLRLFTTGAGVLESSFAEPSSQRRIVYGARQGNGSHNGGNQKKCSLVGFWCTPGGQLSCDHIHHFFHSQGGCTPHLGGLAGQLRTEGCHRGTNIRIVDMLFRQIGPQHGLQRLIGWNRRSCRLGEPNGFCARSVCGLRKHRLPRREVGIEATMREACVLHDVRNARSAESIAPDGTRRRRHDALMA